MGKHFTFSSESVGEGHPDKVADYISDSILDACLEQDSHSRVACETLVKSNCVHIAGEITTHAKVDYDAVIREAVRHVGYTHEDDIFHADRLEIVNSLTEQSRDIAQGVDEGAFPGKASSEQGAGDQGIMFGYASNETPEFMPAPIMFAHRITSKLAQLRKSGISWLRPDCKAQIAVEYKDEKPIAINNIIISTQHTPDITHEAIEAFCKQEVVNKVLPAELISSDTEYFINPTGKFIIGGPQGDAGLTGRKIIVDTYGGWSRHGGGAFSGKDPSKVDRSAAYMCRYVAKNLVAAGLASRAEIQVAYAIGYPYPTSLHVNTFGHSQYDDEYLQKLILDLFSFKPADIIKQLNLLKPLYRQTTFYGHFTKANLPWEKLDKVNALRSKR